MAHNNRYYTINNNDPQKAVILSFTVGLPTTQRYSLDGLQLVIKLHHDDDEQHPQLSQYTEYSHAEILPIMNGPEWTAPIL
jgi:hypothetical protein